MLGRGTPRQASAAACRLAQGARTGHMPRAPFRHQRSGSHGLQLRHRRPAERRQVDPVQRAHRRPRPPPRPTIRSAPSSPTSAGCRCPTRASTRWRGSRKSAKIVADPARDQGHRGAGARRVQGRGAGQQVPGRHPRGRRHPPGAALLRGRRRHPCRGQRRPAARRRADRDRAAAGRPREPGAADGRPGQARARPGQGGQGAPGAARARAPAHGGGPARAHARSRTTSAELLAGLQPADRQARPLRLQRRRGLGRRPATRSARRWPRWREAQGARHVVICAAIEAELAHAGRGRAQASISSPLGPRGARASTASSARATSCWACSPSSPSAPRRPAPGPSTRVPPPRRRPA